MGRQSATWNEYCMKPAGKASAGLTTVHSLQTPVGNSRHSNTGGFWSKNVRVARQLKRRAKREQEQGQLRELRQNVEELERNAGRASELHEEERRKLAQETGSYVAQVFTLKQEIEVLKCAV